VRLLAVLLLAALLAACSDDAADVPEAQGSWTEAAQTPLSPRTSPAVGWTGSEVLVVGGDVGVPDNPAAEGGAGEEFAADGAAYDPEADTWQPIADAPVPIAYYYRTAMVGDAMVIQTMTSQGRESTWLSYDASEDAWTELPSPPTPNEDVGYLTAAEGHAAAVTKRGVVQLLDVAAGTWSQLPPDPITPRLRAVRVVQTDVGTFLCGSPRGDDLVVVDRWDGSTWTRLDGSHQVGCVWHWTGQRLVNPDIQTAPGLDGNPPYGGRLDPATREWSGLPDAPDPETRMPDYLTVNAASGPLVAGWGYVYDDAAGTWTPFGRPDSSVDRQTGATWADGRLVVVGGLDEDAGYEDTSGLSDETWIWAPEEG
jgi:hypothetical protein